MWQSQNPPCLIVDVFLQGKWEAGVEQEGRDSSNLELLSPSLSSPPQTAQAENLTLWHACRGPAPCRGSPKPLHPLKLPPLLLPFLQQKNMHLHCHISSGIYMFI